MSAGRTALLAFVVLGVAVGLTVLLVRPRRQGTGQPATTTTGPVAPLSVSFAGPDRVYTTEHDRGSGPLEATSGSLLVRDGKAWSGHPDAGPPDPEHGTTHSAVLRARTVRDDFRDQRVRVRVRNDGLSVPKGGVSHDYDGVSIGVRYASAAELYYVNVQRRDGVVTIKRKDPSGGGRYVTLAKTRHPVAYGTWVTVEVSAQDVVDGVRVTLAIDGKPTLETIDRGSGDQQPLRHAGRVLFRADNCEVFFDDIEVTPLG